MNIKALIEHQFNRFVAMPEFMLASSQNKFARICRNINRLTENYNQYTIKTRVGAVVRSILGLRDTFGDDIPDSNLSETLIKEHFLKYGIVLDTLSESARPPVPVPAGVYVIRGREVDITEDLLPVDECLGHSVYKTPQTGYFIIQEAKKKMGEDAPVNAVGHGNIAGVSPGQEPPGPKGGFKARMMMKRKKKSPQIGPMDGRPK